MSPSPSTFGPGDVLPGTKYTIVRELGAGGMGVVYQVKKPPEIQGVLKLMNPELTGTAQLRTRFFDEVRILAQLDHPNIVKVFDYDALPDGTPFYVMELLTGRTLRDALATMGRLRPRVAFEITRQLLEALYCAHTHDVPVVHRDIKPENIFLHAPRHGDPLVKLIDFGVIAVADRKHDGLFVGTWRYAAPEQIRGERAVPATDLYAVGLVLYEMLAGRGPFDHHDSGMLVSQAHLSEPPAPLSRFAPWVPPSIVDLLATVLAKDPAARPRDAHAFAERLFELEWAEDGGRPDDSTDEGPVARVLSTISAARPSGPRPAGVPVVNVPSEGKHRGATLGGVGVGPRDLTAPDEDALLEGLAARPDERVPTRRTSSAGRRSDPIVVRPSSPRLETAATVGGDTFASQETDARGAGSASGRRMVAPIVAAIGCAAVVVAFLLVWTNARRAPPAGEIGAAAIQPSPVSPPAASSTSPAASASASASASATTTATRAAPRATRAPKQPPSPRRSKAPRDDFMRGDL